MKTKTKKLISGLRKWRTMMVHGIAPGRKHTKETRKGLAYAHRQSRGYYKTGKDYRTSIKRLSDS